MNNPAEHALSLRLNIPNVVTTVRIVLVVPIIWLLCHGGTGAMLLAAIMLCIAWATDGLDGFLARRLVLSGSDAPVRLSFPLLPE